MERRIEGAIEMSSSPYTTVLDGDRSPETSLLNLTTLPRPIFALPERLQSCSVHLPQLREELLPAAGAQAS